jgi:hypothetical protein
MAQLTPFQAAMLGGVNGYAASQGGGGGGGLMGGGMSALAYSNPYSAAAMGAVQLGSALLGGQDPSNTSGVSGYRNDVSSPLDGSNWTVSTGNSKASSVPTVTSAAQGVAQSALTAIQNPMLLVVAVLVVALWKHEG